jgi:hypothetical protein
MKKYTIYVFLLVAVVGFLFFFAGSCSKGNDYYVKFTMDGEEVEFGLGLSDKEKNAFANVIGAPGDGYTLFVATPVTAESTSMPSTFIQITIDGTDVGPYTYPEPSTAYLYYQDAPNSYSIISLSINVTSFGDVGGTIEGTFEAVVTEFSLQGLKGVKASQGIPVTDGAFRVKRIADNTYVPIGSDN